MERKLYLMAAADLNLARYALGMNTEQGIGLAAFHLQQSVEKALRLCLKESGIVYCESHGIEDLLSLVPERQEFISVDKLEELWRLAYTLSSWEASPRYDERYRLPRDFVVLVFKVVEQLLGSISSCLKNFDKMAEKMSQEMVTAGVNCKIVLGVSRFDEEVNAVIEKQLGD